MKPLKIGEVAKETGVSVKAIRFYEKIGLIPAPDRLFSSGYRLYTERDVRRLRLIKRVKLLGLRLSQIQEIVKSLKGRAAIATGFNLVFKSWSISSSTKLTGSCAS